MLGNRCCDHFGASVPTASPTESNRVLSIEFPGDLDAMDPSTRTNLPEAVVAAVTTAHPGIVRGDILGVTVTAAAHPAIDPADPTMATVIVVSLYGNRA